MSRPHDGQRNFFPFGNPLRIILPKGSYLSPKLRALQNSFESTLAQSFERLKPSDISDALSLFWMRHAIETLSEAHTNIKTLITDLQFPVSDWDEKWIDMYLDSSVKLLDICIALSSELARLEQGQLLLQLVLHMLDFSSEFPSSERLRKALASLQDWMQQINSRSPKLENCSAILQSLAGTLFLSKVKNSAKGKVLLRALDGVKVMTIFICSVFSATLSGCSKPLMDLRVSNKFLWAEAFNGLQAAVNEEIRSRYSSGQVTVLKELDAVQRCVGSLHDLASCVGQKEEIFQQSNGISDEGAPTQGRDTDQLEKDRWQESISNLAQGTENLTNGLNFLSKQVGDFFQIVLRGRDALLCNLRVSDATHEGHATEMRA